MKQDICTIPVNEVLAVKDGCPICAMADTLEERMLDFILGDAMMEPDVRAQTNTRGFCSRHFALMISRKNRLSLALMLDSRLSEMKKILTSRSLPLFGKNASERAAQAAGSCYICSRVDSALDNLLDTFFNLYKKEAEFRADVAAQPTICLPHYELLLKKGQAALDKKSCEAFETEVTKVMLSGLSALETDVSGYCQMFDYRNNGAEWGAKRDAVERAIAFLTGHKKA